MGPITDDTALKAAANPGGVFALPCHHHLHDFARAGSVGQGRARHAGEDHALQHVNLSQATWEAADDGIAKAQ